jgi:hypothetical protein
MEVIIVALLAIVGAVGYFKIWRPFTLWKDGLSLRRTMVLHDKAKERHEAKRPLSQKIHTILPDRVVCRILRWHPEWIRIRRTVRIARRGLIRIPFRSVRIDPAQHIAAVGTTGSGKTSVLRILAAWALRRPDWQVIALDGKFGASVHAYRRHCRVIDDMAGIEDFLHDLVHNEFPKRGRMINRPHLAVVIDESRVFNSMSARGLADLTSALQMGRELGVHFWCGVQDFRVSSIPGEIRMLFTAKIAGLVPTRDDSELIFKELATSGWRPDRLERAGQFLVWEPSRRHPHVSFALWMSESALTGADNRVCLIKVPRLPRVALPVSCGSPVRPSASANTQETAQETETGNTPVPQVYDQVERALLDGPAGPRALARTLGYSPGYMSKTLAAMIELGTVERTPHGFELTTAPREQES